jgi:hypothetical protein
MDLEAVGELLLWRMCAAGAVVFIVFTVDFSSFHRPWGQGEEEDDVLANGQSLFFKCGYWSSAGVQVFSSWLAVAARGRVLEA